MAFKITSLTIVYSTVYSDTDQKKNIKSPRHWPLCGEFTGWPVNSPHNGPVTPKIFPFDDGIMELCHTIKETVCLNGNWTPNHFLEAFCLRMSSDGCSFLQWPRHPFITWLMISHLTPFVNSTGVHSYPEVLVALKCGSNLRLVIFKLKSRIDILSISCEIAIPSYLQHGDPYTGKTASSYWDAPLMPSRCQHHS